jgi:ABC-type Na+ transport system ATPase subunit NatA
MHGDYREDATYIAYPHVDTAIHATLPDHDEELVIDDEDDGMRGVWRSVLSYGQEIERMLAGDGEPLELVQVVDFLRNAYSLPTAESSFGNRHLVVHSISECLNSIFDHLSKTRDFQAKVHDVLFDEANEGVDMDALRKIMDEGKQQCRIRMDDSNLLDQQIDATSKWQARLDALITLDGDVMDLDKNDSLKAAQDLAKEARTFGVRTRNLIQLEKRLEKAQELQRKLDTWRQSQKTGHKESVKYLAGLVRDAHKISLPSTEVWELLQFHREVEIWTDRANVAIRSRISLSEIELLIQRAVELPLDLSESVEKLNSRVRTAREWLDLLSHEVPCPMKEGKVDNIEWMARMRLALKDDAKGGTCSRLHDLASEGTRVSVEIDAVKMLQVELDAKSWSAKARKWLPLEMMANGNDDDDSVSKKGKLEDIREHLQKAEALRDKLVIAEKKEWALDFEDELRSIVTAADKWLDQVRTLAPPVFVFFAQCILTVLFGSSILSTLSVTTEEAIPEVVSRSLR